MKQFDCWDKHSIDAHMSALSWWLIISDRIFPKPFNMAWSVSHYLFLLTWHCSIFSALYLKFELKYRQPNKWRTNIVHSKQCFHMLHCPRFGCTSSGRDVNKHIAKCSFIILWKRETKLCSSTKKAEILVDQHLSHHKMLQLYLMSRN